MPAYSKQLEDKDGNILYPITTAGSVVDEDGVDLQTRVENTAYIGTGSVGTLSPWVDTSDIVDGAVTADKIDFTTINSFGMKAMIYISSVNGASGIAADTVVEFSSSSFGTKTNKYEYDPVSCVALDSGTCRYTHVAGNSLLEVELVISGYYNTLWLINTNHNTLPTGASIIANKMMGAKNTAGYGSSTYKLYYNVSGMTVGDSFYVNPQVTVYGGTASLNTAGTEGFLTVKVFGKG